jgi:hypothetical protein
MLNQVEFGRLGGVSKNTQLAYETGASPIPLDYLGKLADEGVDVAYVVLNQRTLSAIDVQSVPAGGFSDRRIPWRGAEVIPQRDPDMVEIDQIDLRYGLGATYVDGPIESEKRVFSRSWLRNFTKSSPEHLFWTTGDGDSMEPTIRSGEIVLIDRGQTIPRLSGGVWAVTIGQVGMIKRLHVPGKGRIQLLSDNGREPPIEPLEDDELQVVGRVVAVVRRL